MEEELQEFEGGLVGSPFKRSAIMQDGTPIHSEGLSKELWEANSDLAARALFHPFVLALGQGTLPRSAFKQYITEDTFFLQSFERGYEAAYARVHKTNLPAAKASAAAAQLKNLKDGVMEELVLHNSYAEKWGVDVSSYPNPLPCTTKYVNFLQHIANDPNESAAALLAAMVPCLRLYAYLGCTLSHAFPNATHAYHEWLQTYCSNEYVKLPAIAEVLLDELSVNEPNKEKLHRYYRSAMQLELEFFSAQPFSAPARGINLLVVDFDDTCTAEDTTSMIARAAIASAAQKAPDPDTALAEGESKLQWLVQNYLARRGSLLEEILPEPPLEDEMDEFDMAWLGDFIDRLSDFDREMNSVVIDSGILAGVKRGALEAVGSRVKIRPGCLALLRHAVDMGIPTAVVSVNWSSEMVAAALSREGLPVVLAGGAGGTRAGIEGAPMPLGAVVVYCNELEYFGEESTGGMKRRCECAADKGRIFDDLLLGLAAEGQSQEGSISVYIGDSMTDLPALISADVGVIMGSNQLVRQVAAAAGVPLRPLTAFPLDQDATVQAPDGEDTGQEYSPVPNGISPGSPILYEAFSWADIEAFLFNQQFQPSVPRDLTPRELSVLSSGLNAPAHPPRVLSIAGSDSGGGAGIQADIKACAAAGVFASTAVTALTAQNTEGVLAVHTAPVEFLRSQFRAVMTDIGADAVKTGMLPSVECVEAVADELASMGCCPPLVVDPVLVATSGDALAEAGVAQVIASRLFPLATIITPNIHEASVLLGGRTIADVEGMRAAAQDLHALGPQWVLIKGGHLPPDAFLAPGEGPSAVGPQVVDVLFDGKNYIEMKSPYLETQNSHGTGCTLAASIAAHLAKGADIPTAVSTARRYVWRALERSIGLPLGSGPQRPMNHSFRIADWRADLERQAAIAAERAQQLEVLSGVPGTPPPLPPPRTPNAIDLRLYAVTDPHMIENSGHSISDAVAAALDGGATVVQLREKDCDGGEFMARAASALSRCRAAGIPLIINDRVDVALAIGADGVHVGQDDLPASAVRRLIGPDTILGVSVKTVEEARAAEAAGADYLGCGCIYPTATKDSSVVGLDGLAQVSSAVSIPVVAIGGVGKGVAESVIVQGGSAGIAVVSAIFAAKDMRKAASELRAEVDAAIKKASPS